METQTHSLPLTHQSFLTNIVLYQPSCSLRTLKHSIFLKQLQICYFIVSWTFWVFEFKWSYINRIPLVTEVAYIKTCIVIPLLWRRESYISQLFFFFFFERKIFQLLTLDHLFLAATWVLQNFDRVHNGIWSTQIQSMLIRFWTGIQSSILRFKSSCWLFLTLRSLTQFFLESSPVKSTVVKPTCKYNSVWCAYTFSGLCQRFRRTPHWKINLLIKGKAKNAHQSPNHPFEARKT